MSRYLVLVASLVLLANFSFARSISNFDQKTAGLQVWDVANGFTPVYYGAVLTGRDINGQSIHACLALAFTKIEDGQVHYMHKMWAPVGGNTGKCYYVSTSSRTKYIVDNQTVCSPDSDRSSGGNGTRVMSPENMKALPFGQRIVDFNAGYAGQYTRCPYFSSNDPALTQKEKNRLPVLKGYNDSLFNAAVAAQGGSTNAQVIQGAKIQGAFKNIHEKALAQAGRNYWGVASLHAISQSNGYFQMTTNGLGHGLVYKVNLNYKNTSVEGAPSDSSMVGKRYN